MFSYVTSFGGPSFKSDVSKRSVNFPEYLQYFMEFHSRIFIRNIKFVFFITKYSATNGLDSLLREDTSNDAYDKLSKKSKDLINRLTPFCKSIKGSSML